MVIMRCSACAALYSDDKCDNNTYTIYIYVLLHFTSDAIGISVENVPTM